MVDVLIHLVIVLLICGVVWWAVEAILPLIPLPGPIATVVRVLLIVIFAIIIIYALVPLLHVSVHSL
jgi:hypothetical protein